MGWRGIFFVGNHHHRATAGKEVVSGQLGDDGLEEAAAVHDAKRKTAVSRSIDGGEPAISLRWCLWVAG